MPRLRTGVHIERPVGDIWPLVADLERHAEWAADPLTIERSDVPTRFRSVARSKGRTLAADIEVVRVNPGRSLQFRVSDATGSWTHLITLTPSESGTRVNREMSGRLSAAQALLFWVVLLPIKKPNAAKALRKLKRLAEAE